MSRRPGPPQVYVPTGASLGSSVSTRPYVPAGGLNDILSEAGLFQLTQLKETPEYAKDMTRFRFEQAHKNYRNLKGNITPAYRLIYDPGMLFGKGGIRLAAQAWLEKEKFDNVEDVKYHTENIRVIGESVAHYAFKYFNRDMVQSYKDTAELWLRHSSAIRTVEKGIQPTLDMTKMKFDIQAWYLRAQNCLMVYDEIEEERAKKEEEAKRAKKGESSKKAGKAKK